MYGDVIKQIAIVNQKSHRLTFPIQREQESHQPYKADKFVTNFQDYVFRSLGESEISKGNPFRCEFFSRAFISIFSECMSFQEKNADTYTIIN